MLKVSKLVLRKVPLSAGQTDLGRRYMILDNSGKLYLTTINVANLLSKEALS